MRVTNKTISLLIVLPLLFTSLLFFHADTIILKDGTTLETTGDGQKSIVNMGAMTQ
jgi:hypothetical protein